MSTNHSSQMVLCKQFQEPGWLEKWLDEQIKFDKGWEKKVADRYYIIFLLFDESFNNVKELNLLEKKL